MRLLLVLIAFPLLAHCGTDDGATDDTDVTDTEETDGGDDTDDGDTNTDDTDDDTNTDDTDDTADTDEPATALSWATDVSPALSSCNGCHVGASTGGFNYADGLADLVNVPAANADLDYVEPGDHAASYFWHKINSTQGTVSGGSGSRMPLGAAALPAATVPLVADWIDGGANP